MKGSGRSAFEDAREARDRCLAAIVGADEETARSLWKAAIRYNERWREERGVTVALPHARAQAGGATVRDLEMML